MTARDVPVMALPPKLQEVLDDLSFLSDRRERIDYLIGLGEQFENAAPGEVERDPVTRVPGCESEVYVRAVRAGEGLDLRFAVDNPQGISAMAMATVLQDGLRGVPRAEIRNIPEELVYDLFGRDLSMGKSAGLMGMVRMTKAAAR